ncbi:hypothetical protein FOL47_004044 [Perkinsus chesapeaki]|uniref:P-type phospholipid transporter n=1 Tax=Perkinsus chesapeaki TaxID=330153 RepID=A0A7J6M503_PERCH|nr:hypothetical protein FOL47_004044 [Perkinsus chesapeaki]
MSTSPDDHSPFAGVFPDQSLARSGSEPSRARRLQHRATAGSFTPQVAAVNERLRPRLQTQSTRGLARAKEIAREVIPNFLRGRSSSSSQVTPFDFSEDDFPSDFSDIANGDYSLRNSIQPSSSSSNESIQLSFRPYVSDAPAEFHVQNNRTLSELTASDPDATVAEELGLFCLTSAQHRTDFHNRISSTKYHLWSFVPVNLWEQFHRVANVWFLLVGICQMLPFDLSPTSKWATIAPLVLVLGVTMAKDGIEDYRRYRNDTKVNKRLCRVVVKATDDDGQDIGGLELMPWENVTAGSIVYLSRGEPVPADILLVASSNSDGVVYVETSQLDGESALKVKQALPEARRMFRSLPLVSECVGSMTCDAPNGFINEFNGLFRLDGGLREPASAQNLVLRGSTVSNIKWCCGVVVYVGRDTKIAMNMTANPPMKRSRVEQQINSARPSSGRRSYDRDERGLRTSTPREQLNLKVLRAGLRRAYLVFVCGLMFTLSLALMMAFACTSETREEFESFVGLDGDKVSLGRQFLTFLILFNNMIPISLYVTVDIVRSIQAYLTQRDVHLRRGDQSVIVSASNLNDDLGRVDYVLADKTGTLTENCMLFRMCSVGGTQFGNTDSMIDSRAITSLTSSLKTSLTFSAAEKSCMRDEALLDLLGVPVIVTQDHAFAHVFMLTCALCNTVIAEPSTDSPFGIRFQGASPDEEALVEMAASFGYILVDRGNNFITLRVSRRLVSRHDSEIDRQWSETVFKVIGINEFTSDRKRMSVLVQPLQVVEAENGDTTYVPESEGSLLLVKGADDVILGLRRKSDDEAPFAELCGVTVEDVADTTVLHIEDFASMGHRTLMIAARHLSVDETTEYLESAKEARHSITNRANRLARIAEKFERDLIVIGATAVEDKVQGGVLATVSRLLSAGVKVWMLTGDRYETALNIARSTGIFPEEPRLLNLSHQPECTSSEATPDDIVDAKRSEFQKFMHGEISDEVAKSPCIVLDGPVLVYFATSRRNLATLANILIRAERVVACRTSPAQKALLAQLVKKTGSCTILTIGDGANDVPMLKIADIGVGIIGSEGMQAVRASDYSLATFYHLGELLLVHGRDCYNRISLVILYSFFKNIYLILPNVYFAMSNAYTGTSLYESWILMSYNVLWTSMPIILLGATDITLPRWLCLHCPLVYIEGRRSISFNARKFIAWMVRAAFYAGFTYFAASVSMRYSFSLTSNGKVVGYAYIGTLVYYSVIIVANVTLLVFCNQTTAAFLLCCILSVVAFAPLLSVYIYVRRPMVDASNLAQLLATGYALTWILLLFSLGVGVVSGMASRSCIFCWIPATPVVKLQRWLATVPHAWTRRGVAHIVQEFKERYHQATSSPANSGASSLDVVARAQSDDDDEYLFSWTRRIPVRKIVSNTLRFRRTVLRRSRFVSEGSLTTNEIAAQQTMMQVNPRTLEFKNLATESRFVIHAHTEAVKQMQAFIRCIILPVFVLWLLQDLVQDSLTIGRLAVQLFILISGGIIYRATKTYFYCRHYTGITIFTALVPILIFYIRRSVTEMDDAHMVPCIPFLIFIVIRIPFPKALAISSVHCIFFICLHLLRRVNIHRGDGIEIIYSRSCGVDLNSFCQLMDYLPMVLGLTAISATIGYQTELDLRSHYLVSMNSSLEQARSKEVLNNMLPTFVVKSIIENNQDIVPLPEPKSRPQLTRSRRTALGDNSKSGSVLEIGTFARHCGDATVLFCDIAGFPQLVAVLDPKQLITMMHTLFSSIDRLVFIHALTKLETVSESYVVCSGLNPDTNASEKEVSTDAFRAVLLGLDILENTAYTNVLGGPAVDGVSEETSIALVMKIGIHTGPVISGVVGSKRPQFCIFGDTINTASRMKSTANPGRVHISANTRELLELSSSLHFNQRATSVKGKGMMITYDVTRVIGSPHSMDAGVMSPRASARARASGDTAEKTGRVEPFRRPSQASTGASSIRSFSAPVKNLVTVLKRFSVERDRTEGLSGSADNLAPAPPSQHKLRGGVPMGLDKSRDLMQAVETLRRHSGNQGIIKESSVGQTKLDWDKVNVVTLEFRHAADESTFRAQRLRGFIASTRSKTLLLILLITYLVHTIELAAVSQQPPVLLPRVLGTRLVLSALLLVLYALYTARGIVPASILRLATVGVYVLGTGVTMAWVFLFLDENEPTNPHSSASANSQLPPDASYHLVTSCLELSVWITIINFNAGMLFKHLFFTNILVLTTVMTLWNYGDRIDPDVTLRVSFFLLPFGLVNLLMARMMESWERRIYLADIALHRWQKRAQRLLSEFMPPSALEDYLADKHTASLFKNMTIMFADICNYTAFATHEPAERVVSLLTDLFSRFDHLSDSYGIYKVQSADHMVAFARAMIEALLTVRTEMAAPNLEMRIGLHIGKFVGGVIATTKINYDIFGVDVMIANQVEAAGLPGKIVASSSLRGYLTHHFPGKHRFRFHKAIEILVPDDSNKSLALSSQQGVVCKQLKLYEISDKKLPSGLFETVM